MMFPSPRLVAAASFCLLQPLLWSVCHAQNTFPWAQLIKRDRWVVTADSEQPGNEARLAIDNDHNTFWHTAYDPDAPMPHWIQIDLGRRYVVSGIGYVPRQDGPNNGNIGGHQIELSNDGITWSLPVAYGAYLDDKSTKSTFFASKATRFVRLVIFNEAQGHDYQWASMADFSVYTPDENLDAGTFREPDPTTMGKWEMTVDFPLAPAAAAHAKDGTFVLWSSYRPDEFNRGGGSTETIEWDPLTWQMTKRTVAETHHDMFCPGISMDANGLVIVTGGNDNEKTSIYNPDNNQWTTGPDLTIGRGYQSQTTLADGRTWMIGGSWSGPEGGKDAEVWDGGSGGWRRQSGCAVAPMLTNDKGGLWRSDNHAWLFAWSRNAVFQAGPSRAMHWYGTSGDGDWTDAGTRADDGDAMCGMAAMFDAVAGKIFTAGGAPFYEKTDATKHANLIEIGDVGSRARVTKLPDMAYARSFGNAVVLPDGKVVVMGGQSWPLPFDDNTAALDCELFDPATNRIRLVAPIAVARVYHSIGLLLPDGTVLSGGGGLCGYDCKENHFDAQIWSPPYLFNRDGSKAARPSIQALSSTAFRPGDTLTVRTSVAATFSLVRFGSTTHGVNTDQRRVPLSGSSSGGNEYKLSTPSDPGKLLPGYWMLFAMNSAGVPSIAKTVRVLIP